MRITIKDREGDEWVRTTGLWDVSGETGVWRYTLRHLISTYGVRGIKLSRH